MKRKLLMTILTLILTLCLMVGFTACGNGATKPYIIESSPTVKLDMDTFTLPEWQKRYYLETCVSNNSENTLKMYMTCKFGGEDTLLTSDEITIPAGSPRSYYLRIRVPLYLPNEVHDVVIHCDEIKPGEDGYVAFDNTNNENTEQGGNDNSNNEDENVVFCEVSFKNQYDYSSVSVEVGSKIKLEVLNRSGYEFLGWDINGEIKQGGEYITITSDTTCVAKWKELGAFKINYVLNGGEFYYHGDESYNPLQEIKYFNLPYTLIKPYGADGKCFVKWTTDEAGNNEITELTELKEYTLYAQYEPAEKHFTYKYNESLQGYVVIDFTGFAKSIEIPSTYKNIAVKGIWDSCFLYTESNRYKNIFLSSVEIPNSVTYIGSSAFYGCSSLTSIEIPNGVTVICNNAFSNCSSLTSIEIPNSVTWIGYQAFSLCRSLTSIKIPKGITSILDYTFTQPR